MITLISIAFADIGPQTWTVEKDSMVVTDETITGKNAVDGSDITIYLTPKENIRFKGIRSLTEKEEKEVQRQRALQSGVDIATGTNTPLVKDR